VATAGWTIFRNIATHTSSYTVIGTDNGGTHVPFLQLYSGETSVQPLATTAVYAKAGVAASSLQWVVLAR
jgi:hypothetical protein